MKSVLVDSASGDSIRQFNAAYNGVFIYSAGRGIDIGMSEFEFFARCRISGTDLFRATKVRQFNKSGTVISGDSEELIWEDLDTGTVFESGVAIANTIPWEDGSWRNADGKYRYQYPSEFHVVQQPRLTSDFDDVLRALRVVFAASVETGNPVRWG
jgi:hypothetical protein